MRLAQLESKEASTLVHNAQLLTQLTSSTNKHKNLTRECNAQLQQIVDLSTSVNDGHVTLIKLMILIYNYARVCL